MAVVFGQAVLNRVIHVAHVVIIRAMWCTSSSIYRMQPGHMQCRSHMVHNIKQTQIQYMYNTPHPATSCMLDPSTKQPKLIRGDMYGHCRHGDCLTCPCSHHACGLRVSPCVCHHAFQGVVHRCCKHTDQLCQQTRGGGNNKVTFMTLLFRSVQLSQAVPLQGHSSAPCWRWEPLLSRQRETPCAPPEGKCVRSNESAMYVPFNLPCCYVFTSCTVCLAGCRFKRISRGSCLLCTCDAHPHKLMTWPLQRTSQVAEWW